MEHTERAVAVMYTPAEHEREAAANSYLMSLLVAMVGLPFPIVNLIATIIFYFANRKKPYFTRWHCFQALISQIPLFATNTVLFWWSVGLLFGSRELSSFYFAYLFTVVIFNIIDYAATIYTIVQVRKGKHVQWYVYAEITNLICRPS